MTLYKYTGNYYFGGIIMKKLLVKAWNYGDDLVSGILQRYKSRANAKHAFKNCDLRSDIYTVARRFRDGSGTTVGAELSRKYKGTRPMLEGPTYYAGNCTNNTGEQLRRLCASAPDFKMPPTPWTAIG